MEHITFTHKGWFGVCPVYIANLDSDMPALAARHPWLEPLMTFSEVLLRAVAWTCVAMNPDSEPGWPVQVTEKLDPPLTLPIA